MSQSFNVLQLQSLDAETLQYWHFSAAGELQKTASVRGEAAAAQLQPGPIIVLIPGLLVRNLVVDLPKNQTGSLQQILLYAIEDQLASDIEAVHLVYKRQSPQQFSVFVIEKKHLQQLLSQLQQWGIHAQALLPDYLALPFQEGVGSVYGQGSSYAIRTGGFTGLSVEASWFASAWPLLMQKLSNQQVRKFIFYSADGAAPLPAPLDGWEFEQQSIEPFALGMKCWSQLQALPINLLQGAFKAEGRPWGRLDWSHPWRVPLVLLGGCLLTFFLAQGSAIFYYGKKTAQMDAQIHARYFRMLPTATEFVEPQFQIREYLKKMALYSHDSPSMHLLKIAGEGLKNVQTLQLQHLQYSPHQLTLQVKFVEVQDLNRLINTLQHQGMHVTWSNGEQAQTASVVIHDE